MKLKSGLKNGLLKWGRFNQNDRDTLETIENEQGWVDAETIPNEDEVTPPPAAPKRTLAEINRDLGIEIETPAPKSEPQPAPKQEAPVDTALLAAMNLKNSKGEPYGSIDTATLANMVNAMMKKNAEPNANEDDCNLRDEKITAARLIMASRNK